MVYYFRSLIHRRIIMKSIEVIIHLKNQSQYNEIFTSEIALDQYYDDNKDIIDHIEVLDTKEEE